MKGKLALELKNEGDAQEAFLKAIDLAPEFSKDRYELGVLFAHQNRFPESESMFLKVLEENSKNGEAHMMLGMVYQRQRKIADSNFHYRAVLDLNLRNAIAANNLASNLVESERNFDEALTFPKMAREIAPEDPRIADTLGWVYYQKGLADAAMSLIEEAAKKLPDNPTVRYFYRSAIAYRGYTKKTKAE